MQFAKIEQYFSSKENLVTLLQDCSEVFETIDDIASLFLGGQISTKDECSDIADRMTGVISFLNPIFSTAMTFKKNFELKYYVERKREIENKTPTIDEKGKQVKEKFTSASAELEASESVADYRRVRNAVQGYINSAWACLNRAVAKREELGREESINK